MSIHISCDMYFRLGLQMQVALYYILPYKAKISAQHGIGFILDRCIVYLRLTMPNLQKKRLLIFKIFNKAFENTVGKGEIARNEQFLLFPQRFLPFWRTFFPL